MTVSLPSMALSLMGISVTVADDDPLGIVTEPANRRVIRCTSGGAAGGVS